MTSRTEIIRFRSDGEEAIGYVEDGTIFHLRWQEGRPIGRYDRTGRIFRRTQHGEREVGSTNDNGVIHSAGLFEGGEAGWFEANGVVVRGGMIFEEEEIGRVDGPEIAAAAGSLLLIFLPDEDEANRQMSR